MDRLLAAMGIFVSFALAGLLALAHTPLAPNVVPPPAFIALAGPHQAGQWHLTHIGLDGCRCTDRLWQALQRRDAAPAHHQFVRLQPEKGLPSGLNGVPWLLVRAPNGALVYSGGYDAGPIWEQAIVEEVQQGRVPRVRPITGCQTGTAAQETGQQTRRWLKELLNN